MRPARLAFKVARRFQGLPGSIYLVGDGATSAVAIAQDAGDHWQCLEAKPIKVPPGIVRYPAGSETLYAARFLEVLSTKTKGGRSPSAHELREALDSARHSAAAYLVCGKMLTAAEVDLAIRNQPSRPIRMWTCEKKHPCQPVVICPIAQMMAAYS
jgi:hypothetical protein